VRKPEVKRPLERPWRRWIIIKIYVREKEQALECSNLVHCKDKWRAVVNAVMNLRVRHNTVSFLTR